MSKINSFKDLIVWQKGVDLSAKVYKVTEKFPKSELFGLTNQIRRCAVSIPSNIAEGQKRESKKDYIKFLRISYGSGAELETQLIIANKINFLQKNDFEQLASLLEEVMKMLNRLIYSLKNGSKT